MPHREEAGTPNLLGAVAFAAAAARLGELGWERIIANERALLHRALTGLAALPGIRTYGPRDPDATIGVIPFTVDGLEHGLVAAVLGYEHGIAVRSGCFCAHPYVAHLLGLDAAAARQWAHRVAAGDKRDAPGMVRLQLRASTTTPATWIGCCTHWRGSSAGDIAGSYAVDEHGEYRPRQDRGTLAVGVPIAGGAF